MKMYSLTAISVLYSLIGVTSSEWKMDCPDTTGLVGTCVEACTSNPDNCPSGLKCCSNGCGHTCQTPVNKDFMKCYGGATPLWNMFCGRGPNRVDCPANSYCHIEPADAFAVCCPVNICNLDVDPGVCDVPKLTNGKPQTSVKWYYNNQTGTCEGFDYNNCNGNDNRFDTATECQQTCQSRCSLPKQPGTCGELANLRRWYYDDTAGQCKEFRYCGYGGNTNRFQTEAECQASCSDPCTGEGTMHPCFRAETRYRYNSQTGHCETFQGCPGTGNNHISLESCQKRCATSSSVMYPCGETQTVKYKNGTQLNCGLSPSSVTCPGGSSCVSDPLDRYADCCYDQHKCNLLPKKGPCEAYILKWFYNRTTETCQQFEYGGCDGNNNNFDSESGCMAACSSIAVDTLCNLPKETGPCRAHITKWYYDSGTGECMEFVYGGCQGNENRFNSETECKTTCSSVDPDSVCNLPKEPGPCKAYFPKWYYDTDAEECLQFIYGGCQGNGNRFNTFDDCSYLCGGGNILGGTKLAILSAFPLLALYIASCTSGYLSL